MLHSCEDVKSILEKNERLRNKIKQRKEELKRNILMLQFLSWSVRCCASEKKNSQKIKRVEEKQAPEGVFIESQGRRRRDEHLYQLLSSFLPRDPRQWDIYRLAILLDEQAFKHLTPKARALNRASPLRVRQMLMLKAMSVSTTEELLIVIQNILIPGQICFPSRFPFRPPWWSKRFKENSIAAVAGRLKASPEQLREKIRSFLLSQTSELMTLVYERLSTEVCGDESLATAIFEEACGLTIRPQAP